MKLKNIFSILIAAMAMIVCSCSDDYEPLMNKNIKVSSSYVAIPVGDSVQIANGEIVSTTITLTTTGDYTITGAPDWLTITPTEGTAGTSEIKFSAEANKAGRTTEDVIIKTANDSLRLTVQQGISQAVEVTCAEIIKGIEGKTYRTTGVVSNIYNTQYGNFYINDGTGEICIYGTLYDGKTENDPIVKNNIEEGDEVTVEGPMKNYSGTIELVNVTVVKVNKSLIKCDSLTINDVTTSELPAEGGEVVAHLTNKGGNIHVEVPEDAASWLTIKSVNGNEVTFKATPNTGNARSTTLVFSTVSDGKTYSAQAALSQKGAIIECTVATFNDAKVGDDLYRITGIISNVTDAASGNFNIKDATGEVVVYKASGLGSLKAGDIVTVVGKRGAYTNKKTGITTIEVVSGSVESSTVVPTISVADFRNLADDKTKSEFYMLTGKVEKSTETGAKWDLTTYGNFSINDGTGSVYVYGVTPGWGGSKGTFGELGVKEGDTLTIIAYKSSYNSLIEAMGAMYFSHKSAE